MHDQTETALRVAVNQDLLDEIEEPEEPVDEPDNEEFSLDLSEEEEEEALSEEIPDNENQRLSTTEYSVGSTTRTRQSRSSQATDIYSRPYRTTSSRRSDHHSEENDMIIASEDDLDLLDDEGDFELNEEEEEEVLEEEEEEEEEEEDDILDNFDDSEEAPMIKTRQSRPKKKKPTPKKTSDEQEPPVIVDIQRFRRKRRVFTQEVLDSSGVTVNPVCSVCHHKEDDSLGGFLTPVPFVVKDQRVFIHVACALSSLEVARSAYHFYNIFKAVNKAKKIRCCACNHYGATLLCCVSGCLK